MTNKMLSTVPVEIGGATFTLEFTLWAASQYQELTGKSLFVGEIDGRSPKDLVALLWAGLITHHPEFDGYFVQGQAPEKVQQSLRKLTTKIDPVNDLERVSRAIISALTRSEFVPSDDGLTQKKDPAVNGETPKP